MAPGHEGGRPVPSRGRDIAAWRYCPWCPVHQVAAVGPHSPAADNSERLPWRGAREWSATFKGLRTLKGSEIKQKKPLCERLLVLGHILDYTLSVQ